MPLNFISFFRASENSIIAFVIRNYSNFSWGTIQSEIDKCYHCIKNEEKTLTIIVLSWNLGTEVDNFVSKQQDGVLYLSKTTTLSKNQTLKIPPNTEVFILWSSALKQFFGEYNLKILEKISDNKEHIDSVTESLYEWCFVAKHKAAENKKRESVNPERLKVDKKDAKIFKWTADEIIQWDIEQTAKNLASWGFSKESCKKLQDEGIDGFLLSILKEEDIKKMQLRIGDTVKLQFLSKELKKFCQ